MTADTPSIATVADDQEPFVQVLNGAWRPGVERHPLRIPGLPSHRQARFGVAGGGGALQRILCEDEAQREQAGFGVARVT